MQVTVVADQVSYDTHLEEEIHQVTAATERVSIDAHWWSASGGDLLAVLCDGF
jgi:hypothetical protein